MMNMGETLSEDEVTKMMIQADQDSDGLVSFEEFVVMMAKWCLFEYVDIAIVHVIFVVS